MNPVTSTEEMGTLRNLWPLALDAELNTVYYVGKKHINLWKSVVILL